MRFDNHPMARGKFDRYGYSYDRPVAKRELWRPAKRAFLRRDKHIDGKTFLDYEEVELCPDAYYVSTRGRVYNRITGRIIGHNRKRARHKIALLDSKGQCIETRTYRLALDNFIEPPPIFKNIVRYLMPQVNHIDGYPWHDGIDNTQYATNQSNSEHYRTEIVPVRKATKEG